MHLRLLWREFGQNAPEPQRIFAQGRPHPVVTNGRRVALVEDQIDDLEYRGQAGNKIGSARQFEGDSFLSQGPFGPDDALGDGRLRDQVGTRDFLGRQAAKQAEGKRNARLGRERRMTGDEHQTKEVVAHVVVESRIKIRHGRPSRVFRRK